jgi:hypothetical protein
MNEKMILDIDNNNNNNEENSVSMLEGWDDKGLSIQEIYHKYGGYGMVFLSE